MATAVIVSAGALLVVSVALAYELHVSGAHERQLRSQGAVEGRDDVFRLLAVAYAAGFVAMAVEGALGPGAAPPILGVGLALFVVSKGLKYWAMRALGPRWCVRVLVPPGSRPRSPGPYRMMRHPTYLAVLGELLGCAMALGAPKSGAVAILVVGALIARRVVIEERAVADAEGEPGPAGEASA